mmetsp:Transcript_79447/g.97196  ORF Transcript_79447/g.97196 Transcript_79447/m.97196 type:complete len:80 (-) Transcript_79447:901-1140(-)
MSLRRNRKPMCPRRRKPMRPRMRQRKAKKAKKAKTAKTKTATPVRQAKMNRKVRRAMIAIPPKNQKLFSNRKKRNTRKN